MHPTAAPFSPASPAAATPVALPRTTLRRLGLAALLSLLPWTAGCSATGKWKPLGEPPMWNTELPPPVADTVAPNTLSVVLHCPLMEDEPEFLDALRAAVIEQCRNAGMGDVELLRDHSKKAQYEIVVYEAGEDGRFAFNTQAGVLGGIGTGVATGLLTENLAWAVPTGLVGGGVLGFVLGQRTENHAFAGVCRQRTALKGQKTGETDRNTGAQVSGGLTDRDTGIAQNASSGRRLFEKATWQYETSSFDFPFLFTIPVTSYALVGEGRRQSVARETFLQRFPKYVTGGTRL